MGKGGPETGRLPCERTPSSFPTEFFATVRRGSLGSRSHRLQVSLSSLYPNLFEAGPKGQTLSLADVERRFPEALPLWDQLPDVPGKNASFRVGDDGDLMARVSAGGGDWRFTGGTWVRDSTRSGEPVDSTRRVDMGRAGGANSLFDHFSKDESEYRTSLDGAMRRMAGPRWSSLIDSAYGPGSVKRAISELWRRFWSDHEAVGELMHYYDVAQQSAAQKGADRSGGARGRNVDAGYANPAPGWRQAARDAVGSYPLRIGPRYDVPQDLEDGMPDEPWQDQNVRTTRPTDRSFFDGIWSSG